MIFLEKFVSQVLNNQFKEEIIDWYDGPLSFYWISEDEIYYGHIVDMHSHHAFAFVRLSKDRLQLFQESTVSIHQAFSKPEDSMFFVVSYDKKNNISSIQAAPVDSELFKFHLSESLPDEGIFATP